MSASSAHEGRCRSCEARVMWAVTEKGRRMPMDFAPSDDGTYVLVERLAGQAPLAVHKKAEEIAGMRAQAEIRGDDAPRLHVSHFATCPNRAVHRKADRRRRG